MKIQKVGRSFLILALFIGLLFVGQAKAVTFKLENPSGASFGSVEVSISGQPQGWHCFKSIKATKYYVVQVETETPADFFIGRDTSDRVYNICTRTNVFPVISFPVNWASRWNFRVEAEGHRIWQSSFIDEEFVAGQGEKVIYNLAALPIVEVEVQFKPGINLLALPVDNGFHNVKSLASFLEKNGVGVKSIVTCSHNQLLGWSPGDPGYRTLDLSEQGVIVAVENSGSVRFQGSRRTSDKVVFHPGLNIVSVPYFGKKSLEQIYKKLEELHLNPSWAGVWDNGIVPYPDKNRIVEEGQAFFAYINTEYSYTVTVFSGNTSTDLATASAAPARLAGATQLTSLKTEERIQKLNNLRIRLRPNPSSKSITWGDIKK